MFFLNLFSIFSLSVPWDIYNTLYIRILMSLLILRNACKPDMILTCIFIEWADSETVVYEEEQICMCFHCHISYRNKFDLMAFGDLWHGKYEDIIFSRYWPSQRPVTQSFDVFFDLRVDKQLRNQSRGWWFETPSRPLWRQCYVIYCCWANWPEVGGGGGVGVRWWWGGSCAPVIRDFLQ